MNKKLTRVWRENRSFLIFIFLMLAFRSAVADWNDVPTGSMNPTIVEGDRILVEKLAYDIHVPFTSISLRKLDDPKRGDIIVFNSKAADLRLVKRVIGIPGDTVMLKDNKLTINGKPLDYTFTATQDPHVTFRENLFGKEHAIRVHSNGSRLSNFATIKIPENYYLALGDNRDNSSDSRVIGLVPRHEIIGRSNHVVLSFNYDNFYIPRKDRWFKSLD